MGVPVVQELLDDGQFQAALNVFGQNKAGELADVVKDESGDVKQALDEKVTSRLRGGKAPDVVREVIEWLPHTGSTLEAVHELEYARETVKTAGGPASLVLSQRITLVRLLVNAHGDEVGDLAYVLLTANRDHIRRGYRRRRPRRHRRQARRRAVGSGAARSQASAQCSRQTTTEEGRPDGSSVDCGGAAGLARRAGGIPSGSPASARTPPTRPTWVRGAGRARLGSAR